MAIIEQLRKYQCPENKGCNPVVEYCQCALMDSGADEIERLRGALRTIDNLVPKTKEITDLPYWVAIVGDIAENALNGTWPAYGVMPESAKERNNEQT